MAEILRFRRSAADIERDRAWVEANTVPWSEMADAQEDELWAEYEAMERLIARAVLIHPARPWLKVVR